MNDELNTQIQTLDEDVFSQLWGETPEKSVTPEKLLGSQAQSKEQPKEEPKKENKSTKEKEYKVEDKKEEEKELSQEELDAQMTSALDADEEEEEDSNQPKNKNTQKKVDKDASASILQTQAQMLIEKGLWRDFEGIEDFEWNNENYADLVEQQAIWEVEDRFSELVSTTGVYGKAIISHIQNGGNPEEIIDLFKEAKKIESFDTTTEEGKVSLLTKYYKDLGWSDKKAKRIIDAAVDSGSLDEDADEAKAEMEKAIKEEVEATQRKQLEYQKTQKEAEEKFATNITGAIRERTDITPEQKKEIASSLLVYDKKLPDGRIVNQFTLDFAKLQSDPKKYVDLVMFVKDYDKYVETLSKKEEKKAAKKVFDFVKGNGATSKTTGAGAHIQPKGKDKSDLVIDYRLHN